MGAPSSDWSPASVRLVGGALVVLALAADVVLTITNHPIPSLIVSVGSAGVALLTHGVLAQKATTAIAAAAPAPTSDPVTKP